MGRDDDKGWEWNEGKRRGVKGERREASLSGGMGRNMERERNRKWRVED